MENENESADAQPVSTIFVEKDGVAVLPLGNIHTHPIACCPLANLVPSG